jgi:serine/threonine-protein kinase
MIGQIVGSYFIQAKLGEGGMGVVWAAHHMALGRRVAMKMLLPQYSANRDMVDRFFSEARIASSIEHAGMVGVYDFGHHSDGCAYIVMEFLEGETLTAFLARAGGKLPPDLVMAIGRQIASAVGAAHQKGIVHRDLKPDNVFLVADAEVAAGMRAKVLDFGIAKLMADAKPGSMRTRTGVLMGTPVYMSPEQCRGAGAVDARADIYSLGCILYQLICGHPPFASEGYGEVIAQQLYAQPTQLAKLEPGTPRPARPDHHEVSVQVARRATADDGGAGGGSRRSLRLAPAGRTEVVPDDLGEDAPHAALAGEEGPDLGRRRRGGGGGDRRGGGGGVRWRRQACGRRRDSVSRRGTGTGTGTGTGSGSGSGSGSACRSGPREAHHLVEAGRRRGLPRRHRREARPHAARARDAERARRGGLHRQARWLRRRARRAPR